MPYLPLGRHPGIPACGRHKRPVSSVAGSDLAGLVRLWSHIPPGPLSKEFQVPAPPKQGEENTCPIYRTCARSTLQATTFHGAMCVINDRVEKGCEYFSREKLFGPTLAVHLRRWRGALHGLEIATTFSSVSIRQKNKPSLEGLKGMVLLSTLHDY